MEHDKLGEILQEFLTESDENLDELEQGLIKLETISDAGDYDAGLVDRIFRVFSTLKGGAAFLNFEKMSQLAGAGANLALAADVVIASEDAYFVQAFTRIGLIPDAGGTYWLPRQIGAARAMGSTLFADKVSATQAREWGMIYETAPADAFVAHVRSRALQLAKGPTVAYAQLKKAIRGSLENTLDAQLAVEAKLQAICGDTDDFVEGVTAFLEKRKPSYAGR